MTSKSVPAAWAIALASLAAFVIGIGLVVVVQGDSGEQGGSVPDQSHASDEPTKSTPKVSTAVPATLVPTRIPPTAVPTSIPPTATPIVAPLSGAIGTEDTLCPAGYVTIDSPETREVLNFWNRSADIWNAIIDAQESFGYSIPAPFTFDAARTSPVFRQGVKQYLSVLNQRIDELVNVRASGIPERVRPMSLREGDLYDLMRLIAQNLSNSVETGNVSTWNYAVDLQGRTDSYLANAEREIIAVCNDLRSRR